MGVLDLIRQGNLEAIAEIKPQDLDQFRCQIVALIKLERYQEALNLMETNRDELEFEFAYCLYRTNQIEKAFSLCGDTEEFNHLRAMLLYRLERYDEAIKLYSIIDEFTDVETNKSACIAMLGSSEQIFENTSTFATMFNLSCLFCKLQQYEKALKALDRAEQMCKEEMLGEGSSIEEIDKELAVIWAQKGYVFQIQGLDSEASTLYKKALDSSLSDKFVLTLAGFNLCILPPMDLGKVEHGLEGAEMDIVKNKLNSNQREILAYNSILLKMLQNSVSNANQAKVTPSVLEMGQNFPGSDLVHLIQASNISKKKKCLPELVEYTKLHSQSLNARLVLLQHFLETSNYNGMKFTLTSMLNEPEFEKSKKGIQSLLRWVYEKLGIIEKAVDFMPEKFTDDTISANEGLTFFLLKLRLGYFEDSKNGFETLLKEDPTNLTLKAGLLASSACCKIDCQDLLLELKATVNTPSDINEEELEKLPQRVLEEISKVKHRKRKKKPLPKNYDPKKLPDPGKNNLYRAVVS